MKKKTFDYYADIHSCVSTSFWRENTKAIAFDQVKNTLDIHNRIKSISKNGYQSIKQCEQYFAYSSPEKIVVSSPNEFLESGYFLLIDEKLLSMLKYQPFVTQILENIHHQQAVTEHDDGLMFSVRDVYSGTMLDHDTLLI